MKPEDFPEYLAEWIDGAFDDFDKEMESLRRMTAIPPKRIGRMDVAGWEKQAMEDPQGVRELLSGD